MLNIQEEQKRLSPLTTRDTAISTFERELTRNTYRFSVRRKWGDFKMAASAPQVALQANAAITAGEQSFEQFSVTLVQSTMDALVSSAISQMKSYADLVSTLELGLTAFRALANPPDGSAIAAWIRLYLTQVTVSGNTVTVSGTPTWSADAADALVKLFQEADQIGSGSYQLANGTSAISVDPTTLMAQTITVAQFYPIATPTLAASHAPLPASPGPVTIRDAVNAVLNNSAEQSFNQLYTLVKTGLYRIVVTDSHILTRATFSLTANDAAQDSSVNIGVSNFQGSASGRYAGRRFGAAIAASYSQMNIRVASSTSTSSTSITENIMGEVLVNFKGDYFPALTVQSPP